MKYEKRKNLARRVQRTSRPLNRAAGAGPTCVGNIEKGGKALQAPSSTAATRRAAITTVNAHKRTLVRIEIPKHYKTTRHAAYTQYHNGAVCSQPTPPFRYNSMRCVGL